LYPRIPGVTNLTSRAGRDDDRNMTAMSAPQPPADDTPPLERSRHVHDVPGDDVFPDRLCVQPADCCSAPAVYQVIFRVAHSVRPAHLNLCGHHYRASTVTMLERHATVYDAEHRLLASFG
jgi:hypothetical protein